MDGYNGLVLRQVGRDKLLISVTANAVVESTVRFVHTTTDCSGPRYIPNMNGAGLLPLAQVAGSQLAFTRLVDPGYAVAVTARSVETMRPGQDLTTPGPCTTLRAYVQSMGEAVIVSDPALTSLVPPFRVE